MRNICTVLFSVVALLLHVQECWPDHTFHLRPPLDHLVRKAEGPVAFRRGGKYYVLSGTGCCACIGGSTIYVQMADSMKGPWTFAGDVGSRPGHKFDPHSPDNYGALPFPHATPARLCYH